LAGCQGSGSAPPPFSTGTAPPASAVQSGAVSPAGGSVSTTLGTQTITVRAPAGAVSGAGTLTVTVFASSPRPLASSARSVRTIGAHALLLVSFSVKLTGATLVAPLQATYSTPAAASGNIFRLAGFGTSFDDVDTVTWAANTATSDQNVGFSRMSLADATAGTLYAFYTEPSGEAGGVPGPVITPSTAAAQPVAMLGTATFTATEAESNGFPYLDPSFTFSLDNATIGSVTPAGVFTARYIDGAGNITATDSTPGRGNAHGSTQVTVSSQRPGNVGDTFTFTGTLSSTTQLVNSNPTQPQTDTANVTVSTSVTSAQVVATPVPGVQTVTHSTESDAYPLQTIKTVTDSGYGYVTSNGGGLPATIKAGTVVATGSQSVDSNGVTYITQYDVPHGNGILDNLPETAGPFGPNTAALTYSETDPAGFDRSRTIASDGSYTETGHDAFGDVQTITVNPDLSGVLDARQYSGLRFTMSAPSAPPNPRIIFRIFNASNTQLQAFNLPSWIPVTLTQPSQETDVISAGTAFPASCNVPAKYGTSGNQIVQTINRADSALGNLETLTTTTYTSGTAGPVCIKMNDSVQTFYDFTLQNGFAVLVSGGATPIQLTSISETLTLQSAKTSGGAVTQSAGSTTQSSGRATASAAATTPSSFPSVAFAKARFEHAVRQKLNWMRKESFNRNFMSQGVHQL
jgi:hypothetical protein